MRLANSIIIFSLITIIASILFIVTGNKKSVYTENSDVYNFYFKSSQGIPISKVTKKKFVYKESNAYNITNNPWPKNTIKYYPNIKNPLLKLGLQQAVNEWNGRGAIKFVSADSNQADLFIYETTSQWLKDHTRINRPHLLGSATLGFNGSVKSKIHLSGDIAKNKNFSFIVWTISHELGHTLGLKDVPKGCSVMSYDFWNAKCSDADNTDSWNCRVQFTPDMQGLQELYGGSWKIRKKSRCNFSKQILRLKNR